MAKTAEEREATRLQRQRYYNALADGHDIFSAADIANSRPQPVTGAGSSDGGGGSDAPVDKRDAVVIPDGWETLIWPQKQKLAASLTDAKIKNKADADTAIRTELERRAAAVAKIE